MLENKRTNALWCTVYCAKPKLKLNPKEKYGLNKEWSTKTTGALALAF